MRITEDQLTAIQSRRASANPKKAVGHKFKAKSVVYDGIKFQSTLEGDYYLHLKRLVAAGKVVFFLRQVPFHLPGSTRYVVDFQEFHADGSVVFTDVKGMETKEFVRAKKQVEDLYPVEINVVKKGGF